MANAPKSDELEEARTRLESALSSMAQGVASSRDALDMAAIVASNQAASAVRVEALEKENLTLHEQIAAFALQPDPVAPASSDEYITALEAEKAQLVKENQELAQGHAVLLAEKVGIREDLDKTIAELEGMMAEA
ncbi:MAG: hypothetical protein COB37_04635 [Kordiimonadales bacterium]|nr:MAG: hypothetical protein COB37_04635 [Kordiimonadales bacterium]